MALQHPDFRGWNYPPKPGFAPGNQGTQTLLKADKPGSVKVREAFGEHPPVNFVAWFLPLPSVPP